MSDEDAPGAEPDRGEREPDEPERGRPGSREDPLDRIEPDEEAPVSSREEVDDVWEDEVDPMDDEAPSG